MINFDEDHFFSNIKGNQIKMMELEKYFLNGYPNLSEGNVQ